MKQNLSRTLTKLRETFLSFTMGQRLVAIVGTGALILAAFMVFRWVSTPNYAPLYSSLASEDASAVIDELTAQGVPFELTDGGSTIMVPRESVYSTRINLAGQGLPTNSSRDGYSLLDGQDISTSDFKEQTDYKRAMEGELASTIEAIDGIHTAVVHLALPEKRVFADEQHPTTASVLIATGAGVTLDAAKVQSIVNLVASSVEGLDPAKVTVTDSTGKLLSSEDGAAGMSTRDQAVRDFESAKTAQIQTMLDRILGAGNVVATYTANLDSDKVIRETKTYNARKDAPALSESRTNERYRGVGGNTGATGVVGPDGQMDNTGVGANGNEGVYSKRARTSDNGVDTVVEHRETAPGSIRSQHVGVVLDTAAAVGIDAADIEDQIAAAIGIDPERGDTIEVSSMAFDRSADEAAAAELEAAAKADAEAVRWKLIRNGGIALAVVAMVLLAWLRARRGKKERDERTAYLLEQIRQDQAERQASLPEVEEPPALTALEAAEAEADDEIRRELEMLAERQPDEIATLLRGWLVERP